MRKIVLLILAFLCYTTVHCQELSREVISSAGDYFVGSNATLSWTIGEVIIETFTGTNCFLTQGFQQLFISSGTGIKKLDDKNLIIKVFPNPASDFLNVRFIAAENINLIIELIDLNGKILLNKKVVSDQLLKQIDFNYIKPGSYFLSIRKTSGELIGSYKIIKVHK